MRSINIYIISLLFILLSCTKDTPINLYFASNDLNKVVGTYVGIQIDTYWSGSGSVFLHDTIPVVMTLSRSTTYSVAILNLDSQNYSFSYQYGNFTSLDSYHPPTLSKSGDNLYYYRHPGLGPIWVNCVAKKQ